MDISQVLLIIVALLFVFGMTALMVLYFIKRAAVKAFNSVVDKTLNKTADVVSDKVLTPTMNMAKDGARAVGQEIKKEYHESKRLDPKNLEIEVTSLARRLKGVVTQAKVVSELKISPAEARKTLDRLKANGSCKEAARANQVAYVFEEFQERVTVWVCDYCDQRFDKDPGRSDCSSCGAQLDKRTEVVGS